jgi:hypothetical protein
MVENPPNQDQLIEKLPEEWRDVILEIIDIKVKE